MKLKYRILSICLCVAFMCACIPISVSAADADAYSEYIYFNFQEPYVSIPAGSSVLFDVTGSDFAVQDYIFILLRNGDSVSLDGIYQSGSTVSSPTQIWENDNLILYRISNVSSIYYDNFQLSFTNSSTSYDSYVEVFSIFSPCSNGVVEITPTGITACTGFADEMPDEPRHTTTVSSLPFKFAYGAHDYYTSLLYWDINIPVSNFTGMYRGGFTFYSDIMQASSFGTAYLNSFALFYDGMPLSFDLAAYVFNDTTGIYSIDQTGFVSNGDYIFNGSEYERLDADYFAVEFDVPVNTTNEEKYITVRFITCSTPGITIGSLYGSYSTIVSEDRLMQIISAKLDGIYASVDEIESLLASIQAEIESQTDYLSSIDGTLVSISKYLSTTLRNLIASINQGITNVHGSLNTIFNQMSSGFTAVIQKIGSSADKIIAALAPDDGGASEEFQDEAQQQAGAIKDGVDIMGSVEKPDVGDIDADVTDFLDTSAVGLMAGTINIFFRNNVFYQIFSLVLIMMMASYVLFGKK